MTARASVILNSNTLRNTQMDKHLRCFFMFYLEEWFLRTILGVCRRGKLLSQKYGRQVDADFLGLNSIQEVSVRRHTGSFSGYNFLAYSYTLWNIRQWETVFTSESLLLERRRCDEENILPLQKIWAWLPTQTRWLTASCNYIQPLWVLRSHTHPRHTAYT